MKKCIVLFLAALFWGSFPTAGWSQDQIPDVQAQSTQAVYLGKTLPLRDLPAVAATPKEKLDQAKKNKPKIVTNFFGREVPANSIPGALPKDEDPIWQSNMDTEDFFEVEPLVNIQGINVNQNGGPTPPDPCGDIGQDYFIQMVNATRFRIFEKDGSPASGILNTNMIWAGLGVSSGGDPIILYDQGAGRWLLTEFEPPGNNSLLVAVSETSDPLGSWTGYEFTTPSFPDYPKYAIWPNAYVVTTNEFGSGIPFYVIDREAMLNGEPNVTIQRLTIPRIFGGPGFQVTTPVDWDGATEPPTGSLPMIIRMNDDAWGQAANDRVEIWRVDIDWNNSNNTDLIGPYNLTTTPFDSYPCAATGPGFACIPQPNGQGLDGLPEVIMHKVTYRNFGTHESMVYNFITDANGSNLSGIRWTELRRTAPDDWMVYQEGTFAPNDGLHRFMGGIAIDGAGNIGMAYSFSSNNTFPGLAFTGRRANDPLGEMTIDEYVFAQGSSSQGFDRYGDYAAMSVDPVDDRTFWFTGEYMLSGGNWGTKIVSFLVSRDTNDLGPIALLSPQNSPDLTASETVEATFQNFGLEAQNQFQVGYRVNDGPVSVQTINQTLAPDATYNHVFANTADLATVGEYEFTIWTNLPNDENNSNDTVRILVQKLPRWDAGISNIDGFDDPYCGDMVQGNLQLTNYGTETLQSVTIQWQLNGSSPQTINWTGNLASGATQAVPIPLSPLLSGTNAIIAATSNPNGETDEVMSNDQFSRTLDAVLGGLPITFILATDQYPDETTWELEDENGNVLYSGGPYTTPFTPIIVDWCLEEDKCYAFTIFDSFGDGLSEGNGSYNILDENNNSLASIINVNFGFQEQNDFCVLGCELSVDIDTEPESAVGAGDGVIMISPNNGSGPYMYSIDGGGTFQGSGVFENLSAGNYNIVVQDVTECNFTTTIEVVACNLQVMADVINVTNGSANDGSITVSVSNGVNPLLYSIDGGATFQSSATFSGLAPGEYDIVVRDGLGCSTFLLSVTVSVQTGVSNQQVGYLLEVFPNPNDGIFRINVEGLGQTQRVPIEIYDAAGRLVHHSKLARYDQTLTGEISLVAFPAGNYFVRLVHPDVQRLIKIIKQ